MDNLIAWSYSHLEFLFLLMPSKKQRNNRYRACDIFSYRQQILVYPENGPSGIALTNTDIKRLEPDQLLNDSVMDFWMRFGLIFSSCNVKVPPR